MIANEVVEKIMGKGKYIGRFWKYIWFRQV